ncbi:hypothetical protein [Mycetocola zhadangensis]|uniref:Cell wall-binding repeat-containing protein n=1 Tax=Mycetocola zhadangensis TaxID=1164595 RepID=A0A3L7J162_9MICO|nr:hypothetical protein [Mycetocola zhadangensis]RLQ84174.1 hypothetical protein D9V28_08080 [Mycetocola zhadangensis]GGE95460.1 hypothetical protein GCM10011313_18070 [Mycetocola zhadangensis]
MTRRRILRTAAVSLGVVLALSACTATDSTESTTRTIKTSSPDATLTVIADTNEIAASVSTSRELFDRAPVVVVAPVGEPEAQDVAARAAIALGVPLLIGDKRAAPSESTSAPATDAAGESTTEPAAPADSPGPTESSDSSEPSESAEPPQPGAETATPDEPADAPNLIADELQRLKTTTTLVIGDAAAPAVDDESDLTIVRTKATAQAAGTAIGHDLAEPSTDLPAMFPAEIAALSAPESASTEAPGATTSSAKIPAVKRPKPLADTAAIAIDGVEQLASIATTRAAGIPVHLLTGGFTNPQADASVIDALHKTAGEKTIALGAAFGAEPALDWKVRTARTGAQLPGGGQLLFADHQFVAIYGTPSTPVLGVLGEQDIAGSVARAQEVAAPYQALTAKTVVPMFEIIASVAAGGPGTDGNFSNELSAESLRPWVDAAAEAGMYVVIDLQPGRTDFLTQAQQYQSLLELPNVGLALDPEWRLAPDQFHLRTIGSVSAAEVNSVTHWLADLTNEKGLPQKMLIVHQFRPSMVTDRQNLDLSRPEVAMLLHVDGQGGQPDKQATWANLQRDAPAGVAWGWKNFYDEDVPMLTPEQTISGVHPTPELITYQ